MKHTKPLWQFSASDIAEATRSGAQSVRDVTEAALARLDAVNPGLNAVVETLSDAARAQADALDAQDGPKGPLHGVPVTIKVNVDQKGHATTNGVAAYSDVIAPDDAPVVRNLKAAGAVIIGRTSTPEFSFRAETDSPLYGPTHNPWGRHVSAGGSSGGAASAVMAGIGALGHGNDIGGSLRFPASASGAVTLKPGLGRVPAWNPSQKAERGLLAQSMSVQGLIARSVDDLALSMPPLIAPDPRDPFHVPLPWHGAPLDGPIKVAMARDDFGFGLHPEVATALDTAASALSNAGYAVEEVEPPHVFEAGQMGYSAILGELEALVGGDIEAYGSDVVKDSFATRFDIFPPLDGTALLKAFAQRSHYAREWSIFLEEYPLVLCPFLLKPFFRPGRDIEGLDGARETLGEAHWSLVVSFTGLPAGLLPTHIAELPDGPQPIGVQLAGRRWREDLILDAMRAIEAACPPLCHTLWDRMAQQ